MLRIQDKFDPYDRQIRKKKEGMKMKDIAQWLEEHADAKNAAFFCRLAPGIDPERVLGVRRNEIRQLAKSLDQEKRRLFLQETPHKYIEEDMLHTEILNLEKDPQFIEQQLDLFKNEINSWAITDSMNFPRLKDASLLDLAQNYLTDPHSYVRRLAILWIMKRALKPEAPGVNQKLAADENQRITEWLCLALSVPGEEKEIIDAKGWLLCEALIKAPQAAWPFVNDDQIHSSIRKTAIQKSLESLRIPAARKEELKILRGNLKQSRQKTPVNEQKAK